MSEGLITPAVPDKTNILMANGLLYKDYGEATEAAIGASEGDIVFTVARKFYDHKYNGAYGPTKGLKTKIEAVPSLKIPLLDLSRVNLMNCFHGLESTDQSTYYELRENLSIADADYWTNVAFVGERRDNKACIIIIENPLGIGDIIHALKDKQHVITDIDLLGHYDPSTPTTVPYKYWVYK